MTQLYPYDYIDTPESIVVKIAIFFPELDFTHDIRGNELELRSTRGVMAEIHKMVMWRYIPNKCKHVTRQEDFKKNTGRYIYKF